MNFTRVSWSRGTARPRLASPMAPSLGAVLDRNGLRPSRYYVTSDDLVILASEAGVLEVAARKNRPKRPLAAGPNVSGGHRTRPHHRRRRNQEAIRGSISVSGMAERNQQNLEDLPEAASVPEPNHHTVLQRQLAFGYTFEELQIIIGPMAAQGVEPLGSMGNDVPLAVLSRKPQLLSSYFKQLFAQVTNPPIDAIREEIITGTGLTLGSEGNLLNPTPESCRQIEIEHPFLSNEELAKLAHSPRPASKHKLKILFDPKTDGPGLEKALEDLFAEADQAIADGATILILSDRGVDENNAPIPSLLASAGLHHHLIRQGTRTKVGLVLESGEPRDVHHFAVLIGYGVSAINPYLAFETLDDMIRSGCPASSTNTRSRNTKKRLSKAWSKRCRRWAFRPSRAIAARRFSKRLACPRR